MYDILLFGALGGSVRGLVGFVKYHLSYKNVRFSGSYFLITVGLSALIGLAITWAVDSSGIVFAGNIPINPAIAFIIGYAGGDVIENLYKILVQKPILGPLKDILPR